jgi:hypothetical protein
MQSSFKISIATLMGLVAVVAVELALFQGVFVIVLLPPVTMAIVLLNLGLIFVLGRNSFLAARIMGMLMGGLIALFLMVAYYLTAGPSTRGLGLGGRVMQGWLSNLAGSQPDPAAGLAVFLRRAAGSMFVVEFVVLDLIGLAMIWAGGGIEGRLRGDGRQARILEQAKSPRS